MEENNFKNWGKLGGRPKKEIKKNIRVSFRLTPSEFAEIAFKARNENLDKSEYCRALLKVREIPNCEQNESLIKLADNFSKIKNYMLMGIFNEYEKKRLIEEIEIVISEMRSLIKWL